MKNKLVLPLMVVGFLMILFGCSNEPIDQTESALFSAENTIDAKKGMKFNFTTHLSGSNEVPANDSQATGQVIVKISPDESYVYYKLIVANLDNPVASHFHWAEAGSNGGVVAGLYAGSPDGVFNGVLAEGMITADNLRGVLAGMTISDLATQIRDGMIYVNVHTIAIPGGELRGQL
ncbi:CHRD domain-containing protein [Aegicerativicinus sediminis]|uniref:CHRD domain-containing protein n=1 Tax=Aegicerativicinus sediminis TaxID=2893202 RepID=UPI001E2B848B|nr:CHRD domain-containing protein [Aegicerativicinus sediminis]